MNKNSIIITNVVRFVLLVLVQIFILRFVVLGEGFWSYFKVLIYPFFIFLLPFNINRSLLIFLGFTIGLFIDIFYDTPGLHASAGTFSAAFRGLVLRWLRPKGGYNMNFSPTRERMGTAWFLRYIGILLLAHLFWYFSIEAFTVYYILNIFQYTVASFIASFAAILIIQAIFRPVN